MQMREEAFAIPTHVHNQGRGNYKTICGYLTSFFALVDRECLHGSVCEPALDIRHERIEIKSKDLDLQAKEAEEMPGTRAA
jgi:hypothetical protein